MFTSLRNKSAFYSSWTLVAAVNDRFFASTASRVLFSSSSRCSLCKRHCRVTSSENPILKSQPACRVYYVTSSRLLSTASSKVDRATKQFAESGNGIKPKLECERNNQSGDTNVIYVGTLARHVRIVKVFSLSTSVAGICLQPFIYTKLSALPVVLAVAVGGFASFFIYLTPWLLHLVSKRYVTQITLDPVTAEYTATTYTFFLRKKVHRFTAGDVSVPNVPGLFTSIRVRGVPLFIDRDLFTDRRHFVQLFKYTDPLEWEIVSEGLTPDNDKDLDKPSSKKL